VSVETAGVSKVEMVRLSRMEPLYYITNLESELCRGLVLGMVEALNPAVQSISG
jgi:hypothetical protein